jgi:tetratricopeptide (TPR) repeat protein
MKLKLFLSIALFNFGFTAVNAQDCSRSLSFFAESAKVKNYDDAMKHYNALIENCKDSSRAIYQRGAIMFKDLLNEETDPQKKKELAAKLILNNNMRLEFFPDKSDVGSIKAENAMMMYETEIGTAQDQFNLFDEAWKEDQENFTNPKAIYEYFLLIIRLLDEEKVSLQNVFEKYDEILNHLELLENDQAKVAAPLIERQENQEKLSNKEERILKNAELRLQNYDKIRGAVNGLIGTRADCKNLIPLFETDFEEFKDDIEWLRRAAGRLYSKECTDSELFVKLVEQQHKLEPSAKSALYIGRLAERSGNLNKALEYYKQSAELETKPTDKAKVYYNIANSYKAKNSYSNARTFYRKALEFQPSMGRAYLKIADMYADSANSCGKDVFEKQAVYWLAADYADRAGRVSPALKENAKQTADSYRGRAPQTKDIFSKGLQGTKISFNSCWIGESVTVPNI